MWADLDRWFSNSSGLTPHGFCLLWDPGLLWTYAISDIGTGVAYFTIPLALTVFVRRRRDLVFRPIFWLFAAFILLCGLTHWLDVLTLWVPAYGLEGLVKATTATVSLVTAIALWWQMPQALALPSPAQLRKAHAALRESQEHLHQAQKMEAVGQLTGGIAHDFNNMLQVIASGLSLMERRIADGRTEDATRYAASMHQALDRSAALTQRLLAFSRRQTLQLRTIEPTALVLGMEELILRTLGPAVRLRLHLEPDVWNACSDANQLETALLNLAINARDAMQTGGILTIATTNRRLGPDDLVGHEEAAPGDYIEIAVTDTGTGMSPEIKARVFEPFFTTKPSGQGTGLGLSQVYGFIRQSGGFMRIDSAPGHGTTMWLYLPRDHQSASASPEDSAPAPASAVTNPAGANPSGANPSGANPAGATVLVVEDEPGVRSQIVDALRDIGCHVLEAEDGYAGLRAIRSPQPISLLITDVGLPGINGRAVADAAREARPGLPVLFITGYAGTALDNLPLGLDMDILHKPFGVDKLTASAGALLKETRGPQSAPPPVRAPERY